MNWLAAGYVDGLGVEVHQLTLNRRISVLAVRELPYGIIGQQDSFGVTVLQLEPADKYGKARLTLGTVAGPKRNPERGKYLRACRIPLGG